MSGVERRAWSRQHQSWCFELEAHSRWFAQSGLKSVTRGKWYELDVTSSVNGDGATAYRIVSSNKNAAEYSSKEGAAGFAPQLVVEVQ
jgi:hypothetical protein